MSMSENRNEKSPSEESSPSPEVNFGAVAPTKPYAGAPVEVETLSREAGSAAEGRQPAPGLREGMDRRARANMAPGLVHLAEMLPALRLLIGLMIASIVILALYFGRDLLIPLALAMLFGFLLDPAVSRLKRWGLPRMASAIVVVALPWLLSGAGHVSGKSGAATQRRLADLSIDNPRQIAQPAQERQHAQRLGWRFQDLQHGREGDRQRG